MDLPNLLLSLKERIERELSNRSSRKFEFSNGFFRSGQIAIDLKTALILTRSSK